MCTVSVLFCQKRGLMIQLHGCVIDYVGVKLQTALFMLCTSLWKNVCLLGQTLRLKAKLAVDPVVILTVPGHVCCVKSCVYIVI